MQMYEHILNIRKMVKERNDKIFEPVHEIG